MSPKIVPDDGWSRGVEKGVSRELDAHKIEHGFVRDFEIAIQNDFFASLNLSGFKISAIGRRPLSGNE
jgi:hypothetical protein